MQCQQQQTGSSTVTSTDPAEAHRVPQVCTTSCGSTVIHHCGGSAASAGVPMHANPGQPLHTLYDIEQRNLARALQQPSAGSANALPTNCAINTAANGAVDGSNSSSLSFTAAPTLPPPSLPQGPMPNVPVPPSANTAHRRVARGRLGAVEEDPLVREDP